MRQKSQPLARSYKEQLLNVYIVIWLGSIATKWLVKKKDSGSPEIHFL